MKYRGSARSSRSARYDESKTTPCRHRLRQPQPPRVERDPPVKPEVSGCRSFRPAIHLSRIQRNAIFRKRILWPPYLDRALPLRRHGSSSSVPSSSGSTPAPIAVDSLISKSGSPPPSSGSATPVERPVLKMDLFTEASSDSDGSIELTATHGMPIIPCFRQLNTTVWLRPGYSALSGFLVTAIGYPGPITTYTPGRSVVSA